MDPTVAEILNPTKPKSNVNWIFIAGLGMAVIAFAFVILKPQSTLPGVDPISSLPGLDPIVTPDIPKQKHLSNCPVFQTEDADKRCMGCCNDYGQPGWLGIGDNQCPEPNPKCIAPKNINYTDIKDHGKNCSPGDLAVEMYRDVHGARPQTFKDILTGVGMKKSVLACCPSESGGNQYVRMLNNLDPSFDVGSIKQLCCPRLDTAPYDWRFDNAGYKCDSDNIGARKMTFRTVGTGRYSRITNFKESICKKKKTGSHEWIELTKDTPINDGGTMLTGCKEFASS